MKSPAERAKAYRERRKAAKAAQAAKVPLSKEERIALLESKLPAAGPKAHAALDREIALLKGEIRPYATKAADRQHRDSVLAGRPSARRYPVERDGVDSWVSYEELDEGERAELAAIEAQVKRDCPKTAEGWAQWDIEHPGRREESLAACGIKPRPVITETIKQSDEAERKKLLALLLPKRPTADILDPTELPGTAPPAMSPDLANRLNEFYAFDATPNNEPRPSGPVDPFFVDEI